MRPTSEQRAWYFYDFANSGFSSSVVTLFLGPYLTSLAKAGAGADGLIHPLGLPVDPRSYWAYLVSLSVVIQVLVLPFLGALADHGGRKKELLGLFAYVGAAATAAMYTLQGAEYLQGGLLFLLANLAFGASIVVYNAFLPEIAAPAERDRVSSRGWGIGYLGGGVLLALHLALLSQRSRFGLTEGQAIRVCLGSTGVWWALFTLIPLARLRNHRPQHPLAPGESYVGASVWQLLGTLRSLPAFPQTLLFLVAYLIYNDAIQTVIAVAAQFGNDALGIPIGTIALAVLMVQFVAFGGALGFGLVAQRIGARRSILVTLVIWSLALFYIYFFVKTTTDFFIMAAVVAIVMGGSQALSRSLYAQLIPSGREAEYFSLYEISDKGTSWLGPLVFGLARQVTGSYQAGILSLLIFFVVGLVLLLRLRDVRVD